MTVTLRFMDVTMDLRTARLLLVAQAIRDAQQLPPETARNLLGLARAIRSYAKAGEPALAGPPSREIVDMAGVFPRADAALAKALIKHADAVHTATNPRAAVTAHVVEDPKELAS